MDTSLTGETTHSAPLARSRRGGAWAHLRPTTGRLTLVAILLLVVLVSLPRFRSIAIRENELDALLTLRLLGGTVHAAEPERASCATIAEIFEREPSLARRLADARLLDEGSLLLRHGYLFELREGQEDALCAWPLEHDQTGRGAFLLREDGLHGNPNRDARWSGLADRPAVGDASSWSPLVVPGSRASRPE